MRKNTHPFLTLSNVQLKDGSIYKKNWLFFRTFLQLDVDTSNHPFWARKALQNATKTKLTVDAKKK